MKSIQASQTQSAVRIQSAFRGYESRKEIKIRQLYLRVLKDIASLLVYYPTAKIVNKTDAGKYDGAIFSALRGMLRTKSLSHSEFYHAILALGMANCGELAELTGILLKYDPEFSQLLGETQVATYLLEKEGYQGNHVVVIVGDPNDRKKSFVLDSWIKGIDLLPTPGWRDHPSFATERDRGFLGTVDEYYDFLSKHPTTYATKDHTLKKENDVGFVQDSYLYLQEKKIYDMAKKMILEHFPAPSCDREFLDRIEIIIEATQNLGKLNFLLSYFIDRNFPEIDSIFRKHPLLQSGNPDLSFEDLALISHLFSIMKFLEVKPEKESINRINFRGNTMLHRVVDYICMNGSSFLCDTPLEYLLENPECDLKIKNRSGLTPLVFALVANYGTENQYSRKVFKILLKDPRCLELINDQNNAEKDTLLHLALNRFRFSKNTENIQAIVEFMKENDLPFHLKNKKGQTPVELAQSLLSSEDFEKIFGV